MSQLVLVPVAHPRFRKVEPIIFTRQLVADCMSHSCRVRSPDHERLDACCQYGADVDLGERDRILAHADELRALLSPAASVAPWFTTDVRVDADFPSGRHVRTAQHEGGCVFLSHDGRGCAVHRASIENAWDFRGTKPHVCRLFPLTYDADSILMSDDYPDYSCAYDPSAPSVYRVQRETLGDVFGAELVMALDAVEATVRKQEPVRLQIAP